MVSKFKQGDAFSTDERMTIPEIKSMLDRAIVIRLQEISDVLGKDGINAKEKAGQMIYELADEIGGVKK